MPRKQRSDSTEALVRAASAPAISAPSNVPLDAGDMPFFASAIAEFARAEWTAHSLELAAMLSRTMADVNREQQALRREGFVIARDNGTVVENPRLRVHKALTGDILSFRRSLQMHARARGDARDSVKGRDALKAAEGAGAGDSLLARPN